MKAGKGTFIPLAPKKKDDETGLEYNCHEVKNQVYTNTELRELRKRGYILGEPVAAIAFTEKSPVSMGELNKRFYEERKVAKKNGNKLESDRLKLVMNGNYGKCIEGLIRTKDMIIRAVDKDDEARMDKHREFLKSLREGEDKGKILNYHVMRDGSVIYTEKTENPVNRPAPCHVGAEILAQSKVILNSLSQINPFENYYMDTDSVYLPSTMVPIADKKGLINDDMGGFKNDFGEGKRCVKGIFAAAKCKLCVITDERHPWLSVCTTWKGVPIKLPANPAEQRTLQGPRIKSNMERVTSYREYALARAEIVDRYERYLKWEEVEMAPQILWKRGYRFGVTTTEDGKRMVCKREQKRHLAQTVVIKHGPFKGVYEHCMLPFGFEYPTED